VSFHGQPYPRKLVAEIVVTSMSSAYAAPGIVDGRAS
jgi:hypothetical protein